MKKPVGIIAATMSRCREIAKENGLIQIVEGVGDCVFITDVTHMKSCEFNKFVVDKDTHITDEMSTLILQNFKSKPRKELRLKHLDINSNTPHIISAIYVLLSRNMPIGSKLLDEAQRDYPDYFEMIET